jgi:hypothetical protein
MSVKLKIKILNLRTQLQFQCKSKIRGLWFKVVRRKKKYLWFRFPTDPIFFCRPYYFFNAIDRATLFSPGGCGLLTQRAKMASVVTLIIEPNCLNSSIGNMHL